MSEDTSRTVRFSIPRSGDGAFVTVFDGASEPVVYDLLGFGKAIVTFGRDTENDIVIASNYVSRQHGWFKFENGAWVIEDSPGSTNGLIFNNEAIKARIMEDGDSVRFEETVGSVLLVFSKTGGSEWKTFSPVGKSAITIGRGEECNIRLDHISVSRLHAEIIAKNGQFFVVDHNSTNGVIVNGKRVRGTQRLSEKDLIVITNSKLVFSAEKISYYCYKTGFGIDVHNIVKLVGNGKIICNGVTLSINPCEMVAIVGGSGSGKSTIMNCINGYLSPTSGNVLVNGMDLHENFGTIKNIIGYVPQQDIVHDDLTVYDMLHYAARLKLPEDVTKQECEQAIEDVIKTVDLTQHKDTIIRRLSGGQRKRASIALELLSDPNIFFLDEPASGLDPGTEKNLMETLKNMTTKGKTVVFVTHSTLNLQLCDRIIFLGPGGNLCYYGSNSSALQFFGTENFVDVYNLISCEPDKWKTKYQATQKSKKSASLSSGPVTINSKIPLGRVDVASEKNEFSNRKLLKQIAVITKRYIHTLMNDRNRLLLVLLQAPILGAIISIAPILSHYNKTPRFSDALVLYFIVSCAAFWMGISNSIQEVCKERNILKREFMTGLKLHAYIFSKLLALAPLSAIQSVLMISALALCVDFLPSHGIFMLPFLEILITCFLTIFASSAMGLFVSSLSKDAGKAMALAPLLLIPQLLFSGAILYVKKGVMQPLSWATICRWPLDAYGSIHDFKVMAIKDDKDLAKHMIEEKFKKKDVKDQLYELGYRDENSRNHLKRAIVETNMANSDTFVKQVNDRGLNFNPTLQNLLESWAILSGFAVCFSASAMFVLRNINKEGN